MLFIDVVHNDLGKRTLLVSSDFKEAPIQRTLTEARDASLVIGEILFVRLRWGC